MDGAGIARTLAAVLEHVRPPEGLKPAASDLPPMAQLVGSGVMPRGAFDDAVASILESIGADPAGVRGWLSKVTDSELAECFGRRGAPRPDPHEVDELAAGANRAAIYEASGIAGRLAGLGTADRPAIFGVAGLEWIACEKRGNPKLAVVCRTPAERAAAAIWLNLEGVGFEPGDLVATDDAGGYDRMASIAFVDDMAEVSAGMLGPGGEAVFAVPRSSLSGRREEGERRGAVRSGMLDSSIDALDHSGLWRFARGRRAGEPVFLAKTWGEGAAAAFGKAASPRGLPDGALSAILSHTVIPYVSRDVTVDEILAKQSASLRLDDYAQTVPPPAPSTPEGEVAEILNRYRRRNPGESMGRRRFLEACKRAMEDAGIAVD